MNKQKIKRTINRYAAGIFFFIFSIASQSDWKIIFFIITLAFFLPEVMLLILGIIKITNVIIAKLQIKAHRLVLSEKLREILTHLDLFKPSKNWSSEEGYQGELQGYLKNKFPTSRVEVQIGSSRPDIVIDNIAIEVKGPTDDNAINSLPAKCIKYTKQYDYMVIILFRPSFSRRNYDEITAGIKKHFHNVEIVIK